MLASAGAAEGYEGVFPDIPYFAAFGSSYKIARIFPISKR
jgi:hypothetical protein